MISAIRAFQSTAEENTIPTDEFDFLHWPVNHYGILLSNYSLVMSLADINSYIRGRLREKTQASHGRVTHPRTSNRLQGIHHST